MSSDQQYANDTLTFKEIVFRMRQWFAYYLSHWKLLVIVGIAGGLLGLAAAFIKRVQYEAKLTFVLQEPGGLGGLGQVAGLASLAGVNLGSEGSGVFQGDNIMELIRSRFIIEEALLKEGDFPGGKQLLVNHYLAFNELHDKWKSKPLLAHLKYTGNRSTFSLQQDSVLFEIYKVILKDNLTVEKTDTKLNIVEVKVLSKDELFSKNLTQALLDVVSQFYKTTRTKTSAQNVNILQYQTDSVRNKLNQAILGVASSIDNNPEPNPAMRSLSVPSQRKSVDVQANQAILTELIKNLELAKVSLRNQTPLFQELDRPILPLEKKKLGKAIGLIIGGLVGGFLGLIYLTFSKLLA